MGLNRRKIELVAVFLIWNEQGDLIDSTRSMPCDAPSRPYLGVIAIDGFLSNGI